MRPRRRESSTVTAGSGSLAADMEASSTIPRRANVRIWTRSVDIKKGYAEPCLCVHALPAERTIPFVARFAPTGMLRTTVFMMSPFQKILSACTWLALAGLLPVARAALQKPGSIDPTAPTGSVPNRVVAHRAVDNSAQSAQGSASSAAKDAPAQLNALDELTLEGARDMSGEGRAFVETVIDGDAFYLQQPIRVRLRLGVERPFLAKDMVQLFRYPLDVPVQLQAPWFESLQDTIVRKPSATADEDAARARHLSFALDERITDGARLENTSIDGNTFTVLEVETTWIPIALGKLVVPAPILRFAFATGFHDDTWTGRVPTDRRDVYVRGKTRTLTILPFPEEGRPPDFAGAVGHFTLLADASPLELVAGGSLKLTLTVLGEGNLEMLTAPKLGDIEGFHLLGEVDGAPGQRPTFIYDLEPENENVIAIPSITMPYFDPTPPAAYRLAHTRPIPIEVHRRRGKGTGKSDDSAAVDPTLWVGALALASLLILLAVRLRRKPSDTRQTRLYDAALAFTNRIEDEDSDLEKAFIDFLAVVLECASPAVVGLRLHERLVTVGVPQELAVRSTQTLERMASARLGGKPSFESRASVRSLVDAIERALQPSAGSAA